MNLSTAPEKRWLIVNKINLTDRNKLRLSQFGLNVGSRVMVIRKALFRDPLQIKIYGFFMSIRQKDADKIIVEIEG